MILSLDLSTSHVGFCIFDNNKFIEAGCLDLDKKYSIFEKLDITSKFLLEKCRAYNIKIIYIEEYAQKFSPNKSSISTILTLAGFIETIRYILYINNVDARMINVLSARKNANIKIPKPTTRELTKAYILKFVQNKYSKEQCPALYELKPRAGTPKDNCYDTADAIVIGLATINDN